MLDTRNHPFLSTRVMPNPNFPGFPVCMIVDRYKGSIDDWLLGFVLYSHMFSDARIP